MKTVLGNLQLVWLVVCSRWVLVGDCRSGRKPPRWVCEAHSGGAIGAGKADKTVSVETAAWLLLVFLSRPKFEFWFQQMWETAKTLNTTISLRSEFREMNAWHDLRPDPLLNSDPQWVGLVRLCVGFESNLTTTNLPSAYPPQYGLTTHKHSQMY